MKQDLVSQALAKLAEKPEYTERELQAITAKMTDTKEQARALRNRLFVGGKLQKVVRVVK